MDKNEVRALFFDHWKSIENINQKILDTRTSFCLIHSKEIKNLSVVFRNEKVFEIIIDQQTFKKFGQIERPKLEMSESSIVQVNNNDQNSPRDKVITISLNDSEYLDEESGVCKSNTFETFEDVRTLVISDESTLEILSLIHI